MKYVGLFIGLVWLLGAITFIYGINFSDIVPDNEEFE